ncbi:MAG: hypothetical protein AB3N11_05235, partial [Arenibacterium sp.]
LQWLMQRNGIAIGQFHGRDDQIRFDPPYKCRKPLQAIGLNNMVVRGRELNLEHDAVGRYCIEDKNCSLQFEASRL